MSFRAVPAIRRYSIFNVALGTAAFVASQVVRTGDMKIATPAANIGIRGTTGVVDIPANAAAGTGEAPIKLYPDADGRAGRIEVFDRQGGQLGALTQGSSAFAIRPGVGGRFAAMRFAISPQEAARDRSVGQRMFASHNIGRRMMIQQQQLRGRNFRRRNNLRPRGGPQPPHCNLRGPQQPNRGLQQPNRAPGQQPKQRGGLPERLWRLNPFAPNGAPNRAER